VVPVGLILKTKASSSFAPDCPAEYNVDGLIGSIASHADPGISAPLFIGIHVCPPFVLLRMPSLPVVR
jgi:hypothetical protein